MNYTNTLKFKANVAKIKLKDKAKDFTTKAVIGFYMIIGVLATLYFIGYVLNECLKEIYLPKVIVNKTEAKEEKPEVSKKNPTIYEQIVEVAKEEGFEETEKLVQLADCESDFKQYAYNLNNGHSLDLGIFQLNQKYHPEVSFECAVDVKCATKEAIRIVKARGWNEWACNKYLNFK